MRRRRAVEAIQRIGRGFLVRRMTEAALENCRKTRARKIGLRVIRKFIKRCRLHRLDRKEKLKHRRKVHAANKISKWWLKGVIKKRKQRQCCAVLIQKLWRGYSTREFGNIHWYKRAQIEKRLKAASVICKYARRMVKRAREQLAFILKTRNNAACKIQGLLRGKQGRIIAAEVRHEANCKKAALILGKALRRWLVRVRKRLNWLSRAEDEVRMAAKIVIKCLLWR